MFKSSLTLSVLPWLVAVIASVRLFGQPVPVESETGSISGLVLDSWTGQPLPGVIVTVRGTTLATTTSPDGRYQVRFAPPGEQTLVFSKPGYAPATVTEVRVKDTAIFSCQLMGTNIAIFNDDSMAKR
jgi:hypothetical protein